MQEADPLARISSIRYALVILDGLADRPIPENGGRTPTESAFTPQLDHACTIGQLGQVVVLGPGIAPESDAGVFALLGYDPVRDSPGRGVLEAEGAGIDLAPGDVAFRLNFATLGPDGRILDSRVGRSLATLEAIELARMLTARDLLATEGIRAEVHATVGHRGVLWLRSTRVGPLSADVSNADPFYEKIGGMGQARKATDLHVPSVEPLDGSPEAVRTARATNLFLERARAALADDPVNTRRARAGAKVANGLLVRNAGSLAPTPPPTFSAKYGRAGAAVTEMPVERGIARILHLEDRYLGPMGLDRDEGYRERAAATRAALDAFPFVYVHLKGPDEPGHDGDGRLKQEIIEAIDRSFFGPFLDGLDLRHVRIAVTADHATPVVLKGHSDDPVPLLLFGAGITPAPGGPERPKFGEASAARGALGTLAGREVLPLLFDGPDGRPE